MPPVMSTLLAFKPSKRLTGKTNVEQERAALAALAAEMIPSMPSTVKRKHVHYTHIKTNDPTHVQPSAFSREGFYLYLQKLYEETYPTQDQQKSILCFGMVAREMCKASQIDGLRHPHHHGPVFCTSQHYWNKISKLSLDKYKVPLNCVCHDTYSQMYSYLRVPTPKKPLHELDNQIYYSPLHPQGEALQKLLKTGGTAAAAIQAKRTSSGGEPKNKRERLPSLFSLVKAQFNTN